MQYWLQGVAIRLKQGRTLHLCKNVKIDYRVRNMIPDIFFILRPGTKLRMTKTRLFKYIEKLSTKKKEIFQLQNSDIL